MNRALGSRDSCSISRLAGMSCSPCRHPAVQNDTGAPPAKKDEPSERSVSVPLSPTWQPDVENNGCRPA